MDELLPCHPIGVLRGGGRNRFVTPRQAAPCEASIELLPGHHFEDALNDLAGFSHIWVLWWFHQNRDRWRPKVLPPHGRSGRKGLFATRSPHRPNPIGLTAVTLLGIEKRRLYIGRHDMLEGTPILDVKPYLPSFDSFPEASRGWFAAVEAELQAPPTYQVVFEGRAALQRDWLDARVPGEFLARVQELLQRDPLPHRTRRILRTPEGYRLSCESWRFFYTVEDHLVRVQRLESGLPEGAGLHAEFRETFGTGTVGAAQKIER